MRTVTGRTDRVVVVGAGLGGLACALHLAGSRPAGDRAGARAGARAAGPAGSAVDGYEFDTGPTVLTMPDLIAEALGAVGEELADWLDLTPLDPAYRALLPGRLDARRASPTPPGWPPRSPGSAGPARPTATCASSTTPASCGGWSATTSSTATWTRPTDLLTAQPAPAARGAAASAGSRPKIDQFFRDPRTRRIFSFQAMYAGLAPHDALAIYAVIAYLDSVAGVYFPRGGIHAVAAGAGRRGREARRADPLRHRR